MSYFLRESVSFDPGSRGLRRRGSLGEVSPGDLWSIDVFPLPIQSCFIVAFDIRFFVM